MSDFFKDKTYENMDWISKAVEPIDWPFNAKIAEFPEKIEVTAQDIAASLNEYSLEFQTEVLIKMLLQTKYNLNEGVSYLPYNWIDSIFNLEIQPDTEINLYNLTISKPVFITKKQPCIPEDKIKEHMAYFVNQSNYSMPYAKDHEVGGARINEIADLFGINTKRLQKYSRKMTALLDGLRKQIAQDKFLLRSFPLLEKLIEWIGTYASTGELQAIANIAKFKVMTHSGQPIYSMQEVE